VHDAPTSGARVVRTGPANNGIWTALGTPRVASGGALEMVDTTAVAGEHYGYRLEISDKDGPSVYGEVWVDVPLATFDLRLVAQNPVMGREARLQLTVLPHRDAHIELLDATGRRCWAQAVPAGDGGVRGFVIPTAARASGIYWVRATQGEFTRLLRLAVVH
jgi:hypothetical protein